MSRLRDWLKAAAARLETAGVDNAAGDAFALLEKVSGLDRTAYYLHSEDVLSEAQEAALEELLVRRERREPLQHILGEWDFYGLTLKVGPQALIPRQDTELLAETALAILKEKRESAGKAVSGAESCPGSLPGNAVRVLDLCTGSGCVALAVAAHAPAVTVTATDISADALALAQENARRLGLTGRVRFACGDGFTALEETARFDLICCNPPYIPSGEIAGLAPEVREYDPLSALDGGADGLVFYRRIAAQAPRYLKEGGWLLLEIGFDQGDAVSGLLRNAGFSAVTVLQDLGGRDRVVRGRRDF